MRHSEFQGMEEEMRCCMGAVKDGPLQTTSPVATYWERNFDLEGGGALFLEPWAFCEPKKKAEKGGGSNL